MFPAIASSHMAKKAQLLGIWLRALLDTEKRETCACLTMVCRLGSCTAVVEAVGWTWVSCLDNEMHG